MIAVLKLCGLGGQVSHGDPEANLLRGGEVTDDKLAIIKGSAGIVLDQKLTKWQHSKVNSSNFNKESFPNLTFTMTEHFCNLSVIE